MDLLVEQSEESLRQMRDGLKTEVARVTVELAQVEEALSRKTRKKRTGGGRLTRDQVFGIVWMSEDKLTAAQVHEEVEKQGVSVTLNAVRNHLNRLVDDRRLARYPDGHFGMPVVEPGPPGDDEEPDVSFPSSVPADDDIPF